MWKVLTDCTPTQSDLAAYLAPGHQIAFCADLLWQDVHVICARQSVQGTQSLSHQVWDCLGFQWGPAATDGLSLCETQESKLDGMYQL